MIDTTLTMSNKDIGEHFFLYGIHKMYKRENEMLTDKLLAIEFTVLSSKNYKLFKVTVFGQDIDIPEPDGNNLVEIVFGGLEFHLWDFEQEGQYQIEGMADAVLSTRVIKLDK